LAPTNKGRKKSSGTYPTVANRMASELARSAAAGSLGCVVVSVNARL
jgi:hypothetical protein